MKKLLLILIAAATLFVACSDGSSEGGGNDTKTLQEVINSAGTELDLEKTDYKPLNDGEKISINKAVTLKNADVKNAEIAVNVTGVTLENITNIKTLTIGSKVGEGDFAITNCGTVEKAYVNGGGSNSVKITTTDITNLTVNKEGVRILLDSVSNGKKITISKTFVLKNCKLESKGEGNKFENVAVDKTVKVLELKGATTVDKLVSNASATDTVNTKITITEDANEKPVIAAADTTLKEKVVEVKGEKEEAVVISGEVTDKDKNEISGGLDNAKEEASDNPNTPENPDKKLMFEVVLGEGITITGSETEATIENPKYNKDGTVANVWEAFVVRNVTGKSGKNYRASIELKADRETYIAIGLQDIGTQRSSSGEQFKITTNWQTFSVESGTLYNDWKNGQFTMSVGDVQKLEAKNFKIEEIENSKPTLGREYWYALNENVGKIDFDGTLDNGKSAKITFKDGWIQNRENSGDGGVNLYFHNKQISVGKFCKLSFKIKTNKASRILTWLNTSGSEYQCGGMTLDYTAEQERQITLYTPVYKVNETDSDKRITDIWISSTVPAEINITNIDVSETTVEQILQDENRHFAYLGNIGENWTQIMGKNEDRSIQIPISAKTKISGQFVICGDGGWNFTNDISVTGFRTFDGSTSETLGVTKNGDDFVFENKTDKNISLKVSLDEQNRLVFASEEWVAPAPETNESILANASVAGINGWNQIFEKPNLTKDDDGTYYFDFTSTEGVNEVEFKVQKDNGKWDTFWSNCNVTASRENNAQNLVFGSLQLNHQDNAKITGLSYKSHKFRLIIRVDNAAEKQISAACYPLEPIPDADYVKPILMPPLVGASCSNLNEKNLEYQVNSDDTAEASITFEYSGNTNKWGNPPDPDDILQFGIIFPGWSPKYTGATFAFGTDTDYVKTTKGAEANNVVTGLTKGQKYTLMVKTTKDDVFYKIVAAQSQ